VIDRFHLALWLQPHLAAVALCAARVLPVCFLCPLFGGQAAPTTVRLGLALALAGSLHIAGGVVAPVDADSAWALGGLALRELFFGATIGLVSALPFDAARMGGRFIDLFRGTSAEAALPSAGTRESATGDGLQQLMVALAASGLVFPIILSALWRTFGVVKLGAYVPTEAATLQVVGLAGAALATALAIGAPIAGVTLAADLALGIASRAAPQMRLNDAGAPLRILGGGALLWLAIGIICERLLASAATTEGALNAVLGAAR
jgi:flagellar biosynthesis protein FliR